MIGRSRLVALLCANSVWGWFLAGEMMTRCQSFTVSSTRPIRGSTRSSTTPTLVLYAAEGGKRAKGPKAKKKKAAKKAKSPKAKQQQQKVAEQQPVVKETPPPPPVTAQVVPEPVKETLPPPPPPPLPTVYDDDGVYIGPQVSVPDLLDFDLTGGRPGAIIESEEQLERKDQIFQEIEAGDRVYPKWFADYGFLQEDEEVEFDIDDPDALDASTLGYYDITDLQTKFDYEWDPTTETDPNIITDTAGFVQENEKDEEGIEVGYDPMFGPSNPIDTRTKTGTVDSFMVDDETRNDVMLTPEFPDGDPEIRDNLEFRQFRKSLDIIESYVDPFLPDMKIPRHVSKWHGYPEPDRFPSKPYTNNRFTKKGELTNFDAMDPHQARTKAVELARAKNAEWMADETSREWHRMQRQIYDDTGTLVGSLRKGESDPDLVEQIQPALKVLGSSAELLSIEQGTVFRFHYHGLIKNKHGMSCWAETLIRDCGVEVTGVVFETGFRKRDPAYDGGDPYWGIS